MRTPLPQQSSSSEKEEESQWSSVEDRQKWSVAFGDAAWRMLRYLKDSEDLKVGLSELKEQLETLEEAGFSIMQVAQQVGNERDKKLIQIFRQGENEVCIASSARWDTQLKGLVELERGCQDLMLEVELLSERQEVLTGLVEDKIRLESKATERYCETIFEELRELEEKKSKEALLLSQKKHILIRNQSERDKSRMLKRLGGSRWICRKKHPKVSTKDFRGGQRARGAKGKKKGLRTVKSTSPTTENWPRKLCTYSMNNNTSDEDKHDTNYINNKYTNTYTRKLHNL